MKHPSAMSIVCVIAVAAVSLAGCARGPEVGASGPRPGHAGCSDSETPVQIIVGDSGPPEWRLTVPTNYLGNSETWGGGSQRRIQINASFPSLSARPTGTFWSTCSNDALLRPNAPDPSVWSPDRLDIGIGVGVFRFLARPEEHVTTPSDVADLSQVQSKCMLEATSGVPNQSCRHVWGYFPVVPEEGGTVSISCRGSTDNPSASCEGTLPFRGEDISYSFARSELVNWRQYESATRDLLTRFSN